jgi:hypothetical protein
MRVIALAAVGVAVASGCGAASGTRPQPSVRITAVVPQAQVRGAHFFPRERVTVTLTAGQAVLARHVRAGVAGGFLAGFGALDPDDRCGTTPKVVAVGSKGSRASATRPKAECPPPLDD